MLLLLERVVQGPERLWKGQALMLAAATATAAATADPQLGVTREVGRSGGCLVRRGGGVGRGRRRRCRRQVRRRVEQGRLCQAGGGGRGGRRGRQPPRGRQPAGEEGVVAVEL